MTDSNKHLQTALSVIAAAQFSPQPHHIRSKEAFWTFVGLERGEVPEEELNALAAQLRASNKTFQRHWAQPGYQEWCLERDWGRLAAESAAQTAMREITNILMDSEQRPEVKLAAAKVAREYYDRLVPKPIEKMADEQVSQMSPEELREFIKRNTQSISKA